MKGQGQWRRVWVLLTLFSALTIASQCAPPTPKCGTPERPSRCAESPTTDAGGEAPSERKVPSPDDKAPTDQAQEPTPQPETTAEPGTDAAEPSGDGAPPEPVFEPTQEPSTEPVAPDHSMPPEPAGDECNTTSECKAKYGPSATDCVDSRSDQSYCQCGASRCRQQPPLPDQPPPPDKMPDTPTPDQGSTKTPFKEDNGYIVMEMESVPIPTGHKWRKETSLSGYTGSGYYRFTGNNICSGPATSPLRYVFTVVKGATFQLRLRCARIYHCVTGKPHNSQGHCSETDRTCTSLGQPQGGKCANTSQCIRTDISNDAFVHIENSGNKYVPFVGQPAGTVGQPIKLFGGGNNAWDWSGKRALDISGKHDALWKLGPGVYTLVIQGRSQSFRIDRIVLFDDATGTINGAEKRPETR